MTVTSANAEITLTVLSWVGMTSAPHRFGGTEYRLGTREIGHIHGDHMLDIPFPKKVRDAVVAAGRAEPHHLLPETGWISFYLRQPADVDRAIALLSDSYKIARQQKSRRATETQDIED
jgi:hypothetical protein